LGDGSRAAEPSACVAWFLVQPMRQPCLLLLLGALGACASTRAARTDLVAQRAVFDLQCDASSLQITGLGGDSYGVTGCGRRAAYVLDGGAVAGCRESLTPSYVRNHCTAVLNSDDGETASTAAAPRVR
jgi:hypothetical protein